MRTLTLGVVLVTTVLAACSGMTTTTPPEDPQPVLRVYDVPADAASDLAAALKSALWRGQETPALGTVALSPSGQLLVSAPRGVHDGVAMLVEQSKKAPPRAASGSLVFDYWVILGQPAEAATKGTTVAPEIADVLDALQASQGAMKLALGERLSLRATSGERAQVRGAFYEAEQKAAERAGRIVAEVRVDREGPGVEVRAALELDEGKPMVLGQAGVALQQGDPFWVMGEQKHAVAFVVVRATTDPK